MKTPKLKNHVWHHKMEEDGYLHIKGFMETDQVENIKQVFNSLYHKYPTKHLGFWNTILDLPDNEFDQTNSSLLSILGPIVSQYFDEYELIQATIMSKLIGDSTNCPLHRDNSILDERSFMFWNCWLPLIDITHNNGQLYVIKGSHKLKNGIVPFGESWQTNKTLDYYKDELLCLEPSAGDLIIYADRTLHGSFPNNSDALRPVCHFGLLPFQPKFLFFKRNEFNSIDAFEVEKDFYLNRNGLKSTEEFLKDYSYDILEEKKGETPKAFIYPE